MAPNISIREWIRWLPDSATEPTSTIVLTSAENRFVDIRVLKATNETQNDRASTDVLHSTQLDWAFAGTSSSEIKTDDQGIGLVHSTWRHWVDSRTANAEAVVDEGDMFPQPDGRTLECGSMVNPATGLMTQYEECWGDVEPSATGGEDGKVCTVLQLQDDAHKARGVVVRVGQFCQGILRVGEGVSLERWLWRLDGGWKREVRIGDLWLPCGVVMEKGEGLTVGGEVKYGDYLWKVVEMSEF